LTPWKTNVVAAAWHCHQEVPPYPAPLTIILLKSAPALVALGRFSPPDRKWLSLNDFRLLRLPRIPFMVRLVRSFSLTQDIVAAELA